MDSQGKSFLDSAVLSENSAPLEKTYGQMLFDSLGGLPGFCIDSDCLAVSGSSSIYRRSKKAVVLVAVTVVLCSHVLQAV